MNVILFMLSLSSVLEEFIIHSERLKPKTYSMLMYAILTISRSSYKLDSSLLNLVTILDKICILQIYSI